MPTESFEYVTPADAADIWWTYGKPTTRTKPRNRKPSLSRVVRMAEAAGLTNASFTLTKDGITITPGSPIKAGDNITSFHAPSPVVEANEWDSVFSEADSYGRN